MPQATNDVINGILEGIEGLYLEQFDEVSDQRKDALLSREAQNGFVGKLDSFIRSQPDFTSFAQISQYLQDIGQKRQILGKTINFTMMAWIMEGARRANTLENELKLLKRSEICRSSSQSLGV